MTDGNRASADGRNAPPARRRLVLAVTLAAAVLVAGCTGAWWLLDRSVAHEAVPPVASVPPNPDEGVRLGWFAAMVARDETTMTVYTRPREPCDVLAQPQATATVEDDSQVRVLVTARIVEDCDAGHSVVPLTVNLAEPLAGRTVVDAVPGTQPRPIYFERDLPDPPADGRWSGGSGTWGSPASDVTWYRNYNGPSGWTITFQAQPLTSTWRRESVDVVALGPHEGTVAERSGSWLVTWDVDEVTYVLRLFPNEGESISQDEFMHELSLLTWT